MIARFLVFTVVGMVGGFGAVYFDRPGLFIASALLLVLIFTTRRLPDDLIRVGAYLLSGGLVALAIIGPALRRPDPSYFYSTWPAAWIFATAATAGAILVGWVALTELRHRQSGEAHQ